MNERYDKIRRSTHGIKQRSAYTLIELMVVVAVIGIISGFAITAFNPTVHDQLQAVARVVVFDMDYARSLAVSNGSTYKITFDSSGDGYVLTHAGTNPLLNNLPQSQFGQSTDPPTQQTTLLSALPISGPQVTVYGVYKLTPTAVLVNDVVFAPFGETTRTETTVIGLSCGYGENRRIIAVFIDPITGLATVGPFMNVPSVPGFGT